MDHFQKLDALVDSAGVGDIAEADALLRRFKGRPVTVEAVDDFMLDFKTLVFIVEAGATDFAEPARKLARNGLARIRQQVTVAA